MPLAQQTNELSPEEFDAGLVAPQGVLTPEAFDAGLSGIVKKPKKAQQISMGEAGPLRSLIGSTLEGLSAVPGALKIATQTLGAATGLPQESPLFSSMESGLKGLAKETYPLDQRGQGSFLTEDLPAGVGSMAAALPAMALGPGAAAFQFGAQNGVPLYYDVKEATGDEEAAMWGLLFGGAVGQLEKFGAEKALGGIIKKLALPKVATAIERAAMVSATAGQEAGTEFVQQALTDTLYETLTDQDVAVLQNAMQTLPVSLTLGGFAGGLQAALSRRPSEAVKPAKAPEATGKPQEPTVPEVAHEPTEAPATSTAQPIASAAEVGAEAGVTTEATPAPEDEATEYIVDERKFPEYPGQAIDDRLSKVQEADIGQVEATEDVDAEAVDKMVDLIRQGVGLPPIAVGFSGDGPGDSDVLSVIDGHTRLAAAKRLGLKSIPVRVVVSSDDYASVKSSGGMRIRRLTGQGQLAATGIKNAAVESELEKMGLPLPEKAERRSFVQVHAEAMEAMKADQRAGEKLAADLEASPRAPNDTEDALLTLEANRRINEFNEAEKLAADDPSEANLAKLETARKSYDQLAAITKRVGTESGRSLNARKLMVARDYSLAAIENRLRIAKGDDLTAEEAARAKELQKRLEVVEGDLQRRVSEAELRIAELEADKAVKEMQREVKRGSKKAKRQAEIEQAKKEYDEIILEISREGKKAAAGLNPRMVVLTGKAAAKAIKIGVKSFQVWADDMVARFGEEIRPYLQEAWKVGSTERRKERAASIATLEKDKLAKPIQEIAEDFVASGITEREALVDAVHEVVSGVRNDMTRTETRDAISGYGVFRQLTKDEIKKKLAELKGEMRALSKVEDLEAKRTPKKTGFARRTPSVNEKALLRKANELAIKLGIRVKDPAKELAAKVKARRTRLENQLLDLQGRLGRKDFSKKKREPLPMDKDVIKLKAEVASTKRKLLVEEEKFKRANRTTLQKAKDVALEIIDLPRYIFSSLDFSAVRRQGGFFTSGRPIHAARAARKMFKAFGSKSAKEVAYAELKSRPGYELADAAGLELRGESARPDEQFRSRVGKKLVGEGWERSYGTYLDFQASQAFDSIIESIPHKPKLEEAKAIAEFVNIATGQASGKGKKIANALEQLRFFWAPSYMVSRFQLLGRPLTMLGDKRLTWAGRRAIGKQYVRYLVGQAAYYGVLAGIMGAIAEENDERLSIEHDLRSSDAGKVKVGNTRIDPLSGMAQIGVALARIAKGHTKEDGKIKRQGIGRTLERFGRSKAGPVVGRIWDALEGRTYTGEKVSKTEALLRPPLPGAIVDIYESARELGVPEATILSVFALLGDGLQTYEKKK